MRNPILDDIAKLMTDAAGVAQGMRKEAQVATTGLLERWLADQDIPTREDVEALRESVRRADEERASLAARVGALETALATSKTPERATPADKDKEEAAPTTAGQNSSGADAESDPGATDAESAEPSTN